MPITYDVYQQALQARISLEDLRQAWIQPAQAQRPSVWIADSAHLTDEGVFIEVNPTLRVTLTATLCRKLMTLITAAELSKLLPPEPAP